MATTKTLSKLWSPRWITTARSYENSGEASTSSLMVSEEQLSSKPQPPISRTVDNAEPAGDALSRMKTLLQANLSKNTLSDLITRRSVSAPPSPSRKVIQNVHTTAPSQCFVDAMSETHSSVNQFYGVEDMTKDDMAAVSAASRTMSSSSKPTKKVADIAAKRAKISQAKAARISLTETNRRMRSLTLNMLTPGISVMSRMTRIRELCDHAKNYPATRTVAVKMGAIPFLQSLQSDNEKLKLRQLADSKKLCGTINECLAVLGHTPKISSKGIKILSIDGGGTRGLVAIETLKQIEILCQAPIHTLFDYICGVSTGGLLAVLVGPMKMPLDRCEEVYKDCSQRIFSRGTLAGAANLLTRHSFYDMSVWEGILQDELGADRTMLSTSRDKTSPRIGLISTISDNPAYNHVFRNYNHDVSATSQYPGTCNAKVWEAIRASAAAPGYFEDFKLGEHIHQDGGVLNNNPTAIAIHEARALWPDEELQCVVSVGNGRYELTGDNSVQDDVTSLRQKVGTFIHSATNTEDVHTLLSDLLPSEAYFRFNPYMSEEFLLNEIQEDKLQQMQFDTQLYLRRNASKVNMAGQCLKLQRTTPQKMQDWVMDKYSVFSSGSSKV